MSWTLLTHDDFWFWVFDVNFISSKETLVGLMFYFITEHNPFFAVKTENSLQIAENHKDSWKVHGKLVEIWRTVLHTFLQTFTAFWQINLAKKTWQKYAEWKTDGIRVCWLELFAYLVDGLPNNSVVNKSYSLQKKFNQHITTYSYSIGFPFCVF